MRAPQPSPALAVSLLASPAAAAPAPAAAPAATPAVAAVGPAPLLAATRTLRLGTVGEDVRALQRRLATLKYDVGPADGVFGSATRNAVMAFQKVHGLARDAVVGPITRARLASPSTPRPRYRRGGLWLEVNLTKQVMYAFQDGRIRLVINISSGNGQPYTVDGVTGIARTPRGSFHIQRYISGWRTSRLGVLWRPMYFYGGYAIHGSSSVPAYPASHGCIRTPVATQDRLIAAGILKIGRPLYVFD
jgi:hypothetical protein